MADNPERLRELVAQVAASYFANSHVPPAEIPAILNQIAMSLGEVGTVTVKPGEPGRKQSPPARPSPAQIRKSITHDALISFEDNRPYRTLRRHLASKGLTPQEYRAKWGLPDDYPLIAAGYSAKRSELARSIGLGQKTNASRKGKPRAATGRT